MLRGRFDGPPESLTARYTESVSFDCRLYQHDIRGSIAHARMLAKQGIISDKEAELIMMGLVAIRGEIESGSFKFKAELEDVHMNIESRLAERIGEEVAGKLHTARSRNDQVATDVRLFMMESITSAMKGIRGLQEALLGLCEANKDVILPGYTHMQRAQPVLLAHHLLAYFEMLERDISRMRDCRTRTDVLPLGSGALAGVPYNLDRESVARELGFSGVSRNSMDAVSDRDFIVEFQAAAALVMTHLSRMSEELVLWSSAEFGFVEIGDSYTTGSSIMPQKKNPDVAELARGKTARVYGGLVRSLTMLKGLPMTYNRDLQEDKEGLFDTVDTLQSTLEVLKGMLESTKINRQRCQEAAEDGYMLATDIADYLAKKGLPFRQAHGAVGQLVRYAISRHKSLSQLTLEEYRQFAKLFEKDVFDISVKSSVAARDVIGGTAPGRVETAVKNARAALEKDK